MDFTRFIREGVFIVAGDGSVDLERNETVYVGLVYNVTSYGPHPAAIYVMQGYGNEDAALQEAYEILEEYEIEKNPEYLKELKEEYPDYEGEAEAVFTENFYGTAFTMTPNEFIHAIQGTKVAEFVDIDSEEVITNYIEEAKEFLEFIDDYRTEVFSYLNYKDEFVPICISVSKAATSPYNGYAAVVADYKCNERKSEEYLFDMFKDWPKEPNIETRSFTMDLYTLGNSGISRRLYNKFL